MEFDYSAIPTGKSDEVVISINDAQPSSIDEPTLDDNGLFIYPVYSMTLYYLLILSWIVDEKQHPFKTHRALMITSIVSQFVALASATLIYAQKYLRSSTIDRYNTMLEIISIFSAFTASISLTLVLFIPQDLIWVGYLVISLIFAIGVSCYFKKDVWESKVRKVFQRRHEANYLVALIPLLMVLSLLIIPVEFKWTRLSIMLVLLVITFWFCYVSAMKEKDARNLEGDPLIQPVIQEDI